MKSVAALEGDAPEANMPDGADDSDRKNGQTGGGG